MSSGVEVDPDAIRAEGERLKGLAGDFGIVADYATDADPDWHMWGVPGVMLAQLYSHSAGRIQEILQLFEPATTGYGQRFIDSAEHYTNTEDMNVQEFGNREGEIASA
ncbi:hypothetical protein GCM10029992_11090 [Glycomyces albus]